IEIAIAIVSKSHGTCLIADFRRPVGGVLRALARSETVHTETVGDGVGLTRNQKDDGRDRFAIVVLGRIDCRLPALQVEVAIGNEDLTFGLGNGGAPALAGVGRALRTLDLNAKGEVGAVT